MAFRGGNASNIGAYGAYHYYDRWRWPYPNYNKRYGLYGNAGSYGTGQYPLGGGYNAYPPIPGYRPNAIHDPPHYGYTVGYQGRQQSVRQGAHGARGFYGPNGYAQLNAFRGQGTHAFYPRGAGLYYPASWRPVYW